MTSDLSNPKAGTHLVPLARCLLATTGAVLEVGMGGWSSPFLARWCLATGRELVSVDDSAEWAGAFPECPGRFVSYDLTLPELARRKWSVVLIDHSPGERRAGDALLFAESAELIVVHDMDRKSTLLGFNGVLERWASSKVYGGDTMVLERRQ